MLLFTQIPPLQTFTAVVKQLDDLNNNWTAPSSVDWETFGYGGDDALTGNAGNDTLDCGTGNDSLHGGGGNDFLYGGVGNDRLDGFSGNDLLDGGAGDDWFSGSAGEDRFVFDTALNKSTNVDTITDFKAIPFSLYMSC